ncbi:kinase-like domain-containing protein [Russula aff. rugulosa BPL654]|nr:kinase-like domain-containing protein [Russula aff. rugulosa BPL654]
MSDRRDGNGYRFTNEAHEISSLSDEELCKLKFPQPSKTKFTSVRRIASDVVMKGDIVMESEPLTMNLVRESTTIPVPAVRRFLKVDRRKGFVMDYIPGNTLSDCWSRLGLFQRARLFWNVRRYIRQLRRVLVPGITRREPQMCYGPMFSCDWGGGLFSSYDELTSWFMHKLDVNRSIKKAPKGDVAFDSSLPLVLNHLDLSPNNIVVDNNSRIWLIDWEHAGFYPQWFEHTAMCQADWDILGRWELWVLRFTVGFYERQTNFVASIGWAIHTGHLL